MPNRSDDSMILNSRDTWIVVIEGGMMLLINGIALIGNFFMCLVIFNKPRFHTTTNLAIVSLTMCHLSAACLVMPFTAGALMAGRWPFGRVSCDIQGIVFFTLIWISLQTLTILATSRYFRLANLPFYRRWFSLNRSFGMIITIWVFVVVVFILLMTFGTATFEFHPQRSLCSVPSSEENQTVNIANTVITLALYFMLTVISMVAFCAITRHKAFIPSSALFERCQRRREIELKVIAEERKTNQILLALITEALLLWLPAIIIKMLEFTTHSVRSPRQVELASTFLWFAVPVLHPITYAVLSRPFAKEMTRVLPRSSLRRNKVHAEHAI